ncbi:MAG: hypothetical protein HW404_762, partial [Anaerolineales bacterium]|nr:hypothetical protein [Anaerolineales bacterium]
SQERDGGELTVRRRTVVRPPLSSVGMGPCSSIRLRSAQAQTFMVSRRPCAVKEARRESRLAGSQTNPVWQAKNDELKGGSTGVRLMEAVLRPHPLPPLRHAPSWRRHSRGRRGGRKPQGGGGPMAPRLLENLSPPRQGSRSCRRPISPGEALRFATGCCARAGVGVPSDRLYRADDRGHVFKPIFLALTRHGLFANLQCAIHRSCRLEGRSRSAHRRFRG